MLLCLAAWQVVLPLLTALVCSSPRGADSLASTTTGIHPRPPWLSCASMLL